MRQLYNSLAVAAAIFTSSSIMAQQHNFTYPFSQQIDHVDEYFGAKIADPYRWLEDDTSLDTKKWVLSQQAFTNEYLDKIPFRNKIKQRLEEVWNYTRYGAPFVEGKYTLYFKNDGLQNQSVLYIKEGKQGKEEILLDPNTFSKDGTVALQGLSFSKNQKYVAYIVSASGSDWQEIHIMDMATRTVIKDKIEHVKFTSASWLGDEGFYYSGYDAPADPKIKYSAKTEYQKVFFHRIGTDQSQDALIYEDKLHPLRYVSAGLTEDEQFLILSIAEGTDGSEIKIKKLADKGDFITVVKGFETNADIITNDGDYILMQTNKDAPNYKIVKYHYQKPDQWQTLIAEKAQPLSGVSMGGGKLFCHYLKDATAQVMQYNLDGTGMKEIKLPGIGAISGFGTKMKHQDFYYSFTSFTTPSEIYHFDIKTGKSTLHRKSEIKFNTADYVTKQVFYTSKDGTKVPMFITHKKGIQLNGMNPTMLYAYGGFNVSITPSFSVANTVFLENGGIYCVANIRGGAEYGEAWHQDGMLFKKQNVFDDFIAAAEYLIKEKYTSSQRLAIRGGSNGGLLVGAVMTQRPELFAVAIPQVGVLDMLRYHKFTVGWGWVVEYGSSDDKQHLQNLLSYSPLHRLKEGVCYPATLVTTADHDDRVVPAHSFKFAARLQAVQACGRPALIRIDSKAGHGAGKPTSKQIEEAADIFSFMFYNMNIQL